MSIQSKLFLYITLCNVLLGFRAYGQDVVLQLELDLETARPDFNKEGSFQLYKGELFYLNTLLKQVKVFDFQTGKTIRTIQLETAGPNSIGGEPLAMYVYSSDSIYVYSNFGRDELCLLNGKGKLINRFPLSGYDNSIDVPPASVPSGFGSIAIINDELFVARKFYDFEFLSKNMPVFRFNFNSGKANYPSKPLLYDKFVDRVPQYHAFLDIDVSINQDNGITLVSYPFDHNIYISKNGFENHSAYELKSKFLDDEPLILSKSILAFQDQLKLRSAIREKGIGLRNGYYTHLIFDPFKNCYYRIGKLPHDEKEFWDYRRGLRDTLSPPEYFIMVIDNDFNVVKEVKYSNEFLKFDNGLFLSKDGIWVLKKETENENILEFVLINLN